MYRRSGFTLLPPLYPARLMERHHRTCDRALRLTDPRRAEWTPARQEGADCRKLQGRFWLDSSSGEHL